MGGLPARPAAPFRCRGCDATVTELMPWAEGGSAFTRDFEDLVAFFAQQTNQTVISRTMQVAWPTVGNIVRRVVARQGTPLAKRRLVRIGVDEISYRKHHKYLTLVADHETGDIVWGGDGRADANELVSLDMCQAYITKLRQRLPNGPWCSTRSTSPSWPRPPSTRSAGPRSGRSRATARRAS